MKSKFKEHFFYLNFVKIFLWQPMEKHGNNLNLFALKILTITFLYCKQIYNQEKLCGLHLLKNINYHFAVKVFFFFLECFSNRKLVRHFQI